MDRLEYIGKELQKLRIGKMEDIIYDSNNPINDIIAFFKKDCKSYNKGIEEGMVVHRMIMATDWKGGPKEIVTVMEEQGELLSIGIHGKGSRLIKEFNTLIKLLTQLDETPELYIGFLGNRNGYSYYGNKMSNYIYGVAKDVQMTGDTVQSFVQNFYKF